MQYSNTSSVTGIIHKKAIFKNEIAVLDIQFRIQNKMISQQGRKGGGGGGGGGAIFKALLVTSAQKALQKYP